MNDFLTNVLLSILSLDTIRAVIAMLGWIKPDSKYAWLIYGRYNRNLVASAFQELGFQKEKSAKAIKNLKQAAAEIQALTGINDKSAPCQLLILLAKYIVQFEQVEYGGQTISNSCFYIDTMEISHNEEDMNKLAGIMACLIRHKWQGDRKKNLEVMLAPKGGNPLFVQAVASVFGSRLIIVKAENDKSRITVADNNPCDLFKINYEGSWSVLNNSRSLGSIVVDCNTSGGTQLLEIITGVKRLTNDSGGDIRLEPPQYAFVLFCVDKQKDNIDKKFNDRGAKLIRFFDLDEATKEMLYNLRKRSEAESRLPDYYNDTDRKEAEQLIQRLKQNGKFYY